MEQGGRAKSKSVCKTNLKTTFSENVMAILFSGGNTVFSWICCQLNTNEILLVKTEKEMDIV